MMKAISKTVPVFFLVCIIAISGIPAFASASDPSGPAIYFDTSIGLGSQVVVSGVGFSPSAVITLMWGDQVLQTVPNPLVTDSSGAFTGLVLTGKLGQEGINALTATDGKMTAQSPLAINPHDHHDRNPVPCAGGHNSADQFGCGCDSAANFAGLSECCVTGASNLAPFDGCFTDVYG